MYKSVYAQVEVEVELSDFETDDLIEELENRDALRNGNLDFDERELITQIWMNRRLGKDYQSELDNLIYSVTGKVL